MNQVLVINFYNGKMQQLLDEDHDSVICAGYGPYVTKLLQFSNKILISFLIQTLKSQKMTHALLTLIFLLMKSWNEK